MKRSLILLLLLTALLLCACGEEAVPDTTAPQMPSLQMPDIEQITPISPKSCSAELNFAEELPVGTVVELRNGETVVASYTVETATQTVLLSSENLQPGVSYRLTVNGVLQQHSGLTSGRPGTMAPPVGEIPTPSQPAIPEAPAGTENSGGFTPGDSGNMGGGMVPPDVPSIGTIPPEGLPEPPEGLPEPPEFFSEGAGLPDISDLIDLPDISDIPELPPEGSIPGQGQRPMDHTEFRLTGERTSFYGISPVN